MTDAPAPIVVKGAWFPARSSRSHSARLEVRPGAQAWLYLDGPEGASVLPLDLGTMAVSARVGDIPRRLSWPGGAALETRDNDGVDRLMEGVGRGRRSSWAHKLERGGWRFVAAVCVMILVAYAMMAYGLPAVADGVARLLPDHVVEMADEHALWTVEKMTSPSGAPRSERMRVQRIVDELAAAGGHTEALTVVLRNGGRYVGANALALPGGTIVVTDELLDLIENEDQLAGVLAHEIAHVEGRHGLRRMVRGAAWTVMLTVVLEDVAAIGDLAASAPAVLIDAGYSRGFETEADARAVDIMRAAGRDPWAVAAMLENLAARCGDGCDGGWLSTHPGFRDRVEAARRHAIPQD